VICRTVARHSGLYPISRIPRQSFVLNNRIAIASRLYYTIVKNSQDKISGPRKEAADANTSEVGRAPILIGAGRNCNSRVAGRKEHRGR
jgi:hypothetical protein